MELNRLQTIYVSLRQLFSVADARDKLSPRKEEERKEVVKRPLTREVSNATTT